MSVGDGKDLDRRFVFFVDNRVGKSGQSELSGPMLTGWPALWCTDDQVDGMVQFRDKFLGGAFASLLVPKHS